MQNHAAIYVRSSPDFPLSTEEQAERLKAVASERGWTVEHFFADRPMTVRKGGERRPAEQALLTAVRNGTVNRVLLCSICRLGRSLSDLTTLLQACRSTGVSLWLDEQRIDTAEPNRLSLLDVGDMMALHLRQSRRGRILQGLAASRAMAIRCGRPPLSKAKIRKAEQELAAGKSLRVVARIAGISAASVSRLKAAMQTASL
jgi:DNA invertase Pin-like site-specific DNA recombinase